MNPLKNDPLSVSPEALGNRFGLQVAARLSAGAQDLPYEVAERLRAARVQAVARRKRPAEAAVLRLRPKLLVQGHGGTAVLGFGDDTLGFWGRLGSLAALVALAVALVTVNLVQTDNRATDEAEVDAALLTDDLPPQAYADPGFAQFLNTAASQQQAAQTR